MTLNYNGVVVDGNVIRFTATPVYDATGSVLLYVRYEVTVEG